MGLSEGEIEILTNYYHHRSIMAKKERDLSKSHSIEEAQGLHNKKYT